MTSSSDTVADQFAFLKSEWPAVYEAAARVEAAVYPDPRTACFYARRALELAVGWAYKYDPALRLPYQDNLSALIHDPTFKAAATEAVFAKARLINSLGNRAVHSNRAIQQLDSLTAVRELFHVCYWLAHTYARGPRPASGLALDEAALPRTTPIPRQTADQLRSLKDELAERDEKLAALLSDKTDLDDELKQLRKEVAAAKKASAAQPDAHDYSEAQTRTALIDQLLGESGWLLEEKRDREFPVTGMPDGKPGRVDYVLWGNDGAPLGLVEAKKTSRSAKEGQHQAKLYADALEARFHRRPVIFFTNGFQTWLWDDVNYPPRKVRGFYSQSELELMIQRRTTRRPLAATEINGLIVGRYYQTRAIRRIGEAFEEHKERKVLVVMATGAGKTRTVIALSDLLMRCNWAKRVLFLADRRALVKQAVNAFKVHLPESAPVNLIEERYADGRIYVSTYPTMMGLIDEYQGGERRFGPGFFDLVVIDEAHRSVYQKYREIFEYFDSFLVGLTATPKDEVDINTYSLFDLERGVPTDAYGLDEAVADGFLVPFKAVSVPLKFQREGIVYEERSEEEKELWDAIEWDDDGTLMDKVGAEAINKWLFNEDTLDKMLAHVMERGIKVAGGDRLGKTIIFAKNVKHAEFIEERFNANYPHYKGTFAQVIHHGVSYSENLIDNFSNPTSDPHIAISVDMLDTGIDIPEVVNLVFVKMVRSKTKFWQMIGRGTRLCPDLFGPGQDKRDFYVLDYCQNLEFFSQNLVTVDGTIAEPLGTRLFKKRLELVSELDSAAAAAPELDMAAEPAAAYGIPPEVVLRGEVTGILREAVAAMNPENFVVRPRRELVEKYSEVEAWALLDQSALSTLASEVAGLPTGLPSEDEEAKRFDMLMLRLQLAVLRSEPGFEGLSAQVRDIAGLLEEKSNIPGVRDQMALIQQIQEDDWWIDVTAPMLDQVRKRLRSLVRLIEKVKRKVIYTDFEDEIGTETVVAFGLLGGEGDFERFKAKVRRFLREHQDRMVIHKLRTNQPLTSTDLGELERILAESGAGGEEEIEQARQRSQGLGLFVRSLVGLDREAAKQAFAGFLEGRNLTSDQLEFVNLIIDHLTEHGIMEPARLYGSPFTDLTAKGPDGLFTIEQVEELVGTLRSVRASAEAA